MTGAAVAMMVTVCLLVWGGFAGFLIFVMRVEKKKSRKE